MIVSSTSKPPTCRQDNKEGISPRNVLFPKTFVVFLVVLLGASAHRRELAFSIAPCKGQRGRASCPSRLYHSSPSDQQTTEVSNLWGQERNSEEIERHVFQSLASLPHSPDDAEVVSAPSVNVLSAEPPLLLIHDFMSSHDCESIVNASLSQQLQRSTMNAEQDESLARTSSTTWLRESVDDGGYTRALRRMAESTSRISGLPTDHQENLQVVRYTSGQEFQIHTDHLDSFNDLECRGRLATCLVYLRAPESGGATRFHEFEVDVEPKQGSALFFWNTVERPGSPDYEATMFLHADERLRHAGLPVLKGEKWICNRWIHPIDYGAGVRGLQ